MKLSHVNTSDINAAVSLGCRTMSSVFNADDNDIPFFGSCVYPNARLSFHKMFSEAHVPGRHLLALLNAEFVLGIPVAPETIARHAAAAYFSFSGPLKLPLSRNELASPLATFWDVNLREGLHALYALARFRKDERALSLAKECIHTCLELCDDNLQWKPEPFAAAGIVHQPSGFVGSFGRALAPLLKLHQTTGCSEALELAHKITEILVARHFDARGNYSENLGFHVHSTTSTLSGLAMMAEFTQDDRITSRVKAFFDNGLWTVRDQIGWSIEGKNREGASSECGESNNTGDIIETALSLARLGYPEYYNDVELMLRAHLLPLQLRDISFITNPPNPNNEDGLRDVANRNLGAFGFPAAYTHYPISWTDSSDESIRFAMDIVGGAVDSLLVASQSCASRIDQTTCIHLLFDYESDFVRVESPYTAEALRITPKVAGALAIRVPAWSDASQWKIVPANLVWKLEGSYLRCDSVPAGTTITVHFPLSERHLTLKHKTRDIRVRLRGDEPVAMDNFGSQFYFFDPY